MNRFETDSQGLAVFLLALGAFLMALWVVIGFIWLRDRSERMNPNKSVKLLDCSWMLRVDGASFNRDINSPNNLEWQLRLNLRNTGKWPLRVDIIEHNCVIENIISDQQLENKIPFVLPPDMPVTVAFPAYRKDVLPDKERYKGTVYIYTRYGHPDGDYSRIMKRRYTFEQIIKPTLPFGIQRELIPFSGSMPLSLSPTEEDIDEPYTSKIR